MNDFEFAKRLQIPEDAMRAAFALDISETLCSEMRTLFDADMDAFTARAHTFSHSEALVLRLYLRWAKELYPKYQALHIPDAIYWDTFRDLSIWCKACPQRTGRPGLTSWSWNRHALKMELFRIGRLQYQPRLLTDSIPQGHLQSGTAVLEVHVPADGPLQNVQESMEEALRFFSDVFGKQYAAFHCESWLLASELRGMLPENSHILRFQSLFDLYAEQYQFAQAEERVFGTILPDPSAYPENTALQRNLKRYLLTGKKVGMGLGFLLIG